jgi:aspartyl/asparaginyl beta-hydroxylase (cupin superfamily)
MRPAPAGEAIAAAERLVSGGDLAGAAAALDAALKGTAAEPAQWLKLAGLERALGHPKAALAAVHQALASAPFDFVGLVMRAGLLERLGDAAAGAAWEEALAQRPPGELVPPLAAAVAAGDRTLAEWREVRSARLRAASAQLERDAGGDSAWRIARFRDNVMRRTRVYHSNPTHFYFPGLAEREFHPSERFPWLKDLAAATDTIRAEMQAVMASQRAELEPYIQYAAHEALEQWNPLNHNLDWTAIHLLRQGDAIHANAEQCPMTMALLAQLPQRQVQGASPNAMFSLLAPQTTIPPHVGVDNTRLVCHLPLIIPEGCWFRVGAETRAWHEGEPFVFDDTIEHEAANPTNRLRVVLIFDVWNPDLEPAERAAVASIIAADGRTDAAL